MVNNYSLLLVTAILQTIFIIIFTIILLPQYLGKNYLTYILITGLISYSLGTISVAIANMKEVTNKYGFIKEPFTILPIMSLCFIDIINTLFIYIFLLF